MPNDDADYALKLAAAMLRFWLVRGYLSEARQRLKQLFQFSDKFTPTQDLAVVLSGAGTFAQSQGDYFESKTYFEESLAVWRRLGDKKGIAETLNHLGWIGWRLSDFNRTLELSQESLKLHRKESNLPGVATSLTNLGATYHNRGDINKAHKSHAEALKIRRQLSDQRGVAFSLINLGQALSWSGKHQQAATDLEEAIKIFENLGDRQLLAYAWNIYADLQYRLGELENAANLITERALPIVRQIESKFGQALSLRVLGDAKLALGEVESARGCHQESLQLREQTFDRWCVAQSLNRLAKVARAAGDLDLALKEERESLTLRRDMEDKLGIAECMEGFADWIYQNRRPEDTAIFLGAADALRNRIKAPRPPIDLDLFEEQVVYTRSALGEDTFSKKWNSGSQFSWKQIVDFAMKITSA